MLVSNECARRKRLHGSRASASPRSASTTATSTGRSRRSSAAAASSSPSTRRSRTSSAAFAKRFPQAKLARSEQEILEDASIQLIVSASIPNERAPLGIAVMRHGKDFMVDKPGITTLEQLAEVRRVQAETKRIYSILYSERHENRATVKAGELVKAGAIGRVMQTIGLRAAPHEPEDAPAVVLRARALRRHPLRHRLAPVRPVPVLHRLDRRPRSSPRRWATSTTRSIPGSRTSAT